MSIPRNEILRVYIGPVSGGGAMGQLGQIEVVTEALKKAGIANGRIQSAEYIPDLCMGASGGNMALYIALSGNWSNGGITRVVQMLDPRMISRSWFPKGLDFLPSFVLGIVEGSLFKDGYTAEKLLESFNNTKNIQDVEIWSLAMNKTQKRASLFCNKKLTDSYVSSTTYSPFTFKTTPLEYLNGDIRLISNVIAASASIPLIFEPKKIIGEDDYIDGGVAAASPFEFLSPEIYKIMKGIVVPYEYEKVLDPYPMPLPSENPNLASRRNKQLLQMVYFSPYDINSSNDTKSTLGNGSVFSFISDYSSIKDRYTGINLLQQMLNTGEEIKVIDSRVSTINLEDVLATHYFKNFYLEMCLIDNPWFDIVNFTAEELLKLINQSKSNIQWLFYYNDTI